MTGIYCITNKTNGMVYVGQSVNIQQRWKAHRNRPFNPNTSQYNTPLYRAIRKYGLKNFIFTVLEECEKDLLNQRQVFWINKLDSFKNGYNLTPGGDNNNSNVKLAEKDIEEIKKLLLTSKISQADIANMYEVTQRAISAINIGETWFDSSISYPIRKERIITKKEYFCLDCGKSITSGGTRCVQCAKIASRVVNRPSRNELKKLIRTEPFVKIAETYSVSDTAIKKWCKTYGLPSKKADIKHFSDIEWDKI